MELAVIGNEEFILGFQLAGIRNTFKIGKEPLKDIKDMKKKSNIAVVVIEENIMDKLDPHDRHEIESSISPVFVPLSDTAEQESLRRLIKKSIGVDLWKMN